jgi:urease gamma subunit
MDDTKNELGLITAGIRKHIDDNARKESDVNEYMNYYKELTIRYNRVQDKCNDLLREVKIKKSNTFRIELFIQ